MGAIYTEAFRLHAKVNFMLRWINTISRPLHNASAYRAGSDFFIYYLLPRERFLLEDISQPCIRDFYTVQRSLFSICRFSPETGLAFLWWQVTRVIHPSMVQPWFTFCCAERCSSTRFNAVIKDNHRSCRPLESRRIGLGRLDDDLIYQMYEIISETEC